jgi:hypothetical protein
MLTLSALRSWTNESKERLLSGIDYLSVYIPASVAWNADFRGFTIGVAERGTSDLLSVSLFRHNVLVALLETCMEAANAELRHDALLSRFHIPMDEETEAVLCGELSKGWGIEPGASTILGLRQRVTQRIRVLQHLTVEAGVDRLSANKLLSDYPFVAAFFWDDAAALLDLLREQFGFKYRICLCFDELEIAPAPIALSIMRAPRSLDQRILIKFSAAPYVSAQRDRSDPTVPMEQNDFNLVFLSSFATAKIRPFSEALFRSICNAHELVGTSVEILGLSFLDATGEASEAPSEAVAGRYGPEGRRQRKYLSLFERDPSFRAYALEKGMDVHDLSFGSEKRRAAAVRKVLWPVLIREEFLFQQELAGDQRRRLRSKSPVSDIYTGAGSIFALCEGNPRWLIGLLHPMIASIAPPAGSGKVVNRSLQKALIEKMIASYFAVLSTVPGKETARQIESLVDLVDRIGMYFQSSVLGKEFNADPVLSFSVDRAVPPGVRELIGRGINMGAFVTTQDSQASETYFVGEIAGLKVRLANMFAPFFKLPLAGGRTINLSTILSRSKDTQSSVLFDLFGEKI